MVIMRDNIFETYVVGFQKEKRPDSLNCLTELIASLVTFT